MFQFFLYFRQKLPLFTVFLSLHPCYLFDRSFRPKVGILQFSPFALLTLFFSLSSYYSQEHLIQFYFQHHQDRLQSHQIPPFFSLSLIYPPKHSHYFSALKTEYPCHSQTSLPFPVDSPHFSIPMINEAINFNKIKGYNAPPSSQQPNPTHKLQVPQSSSPFTCFSAKGNPLLLNFLQHVPLLTFRFITLLLQTVILILALLAKIEQKEAFPSHSGRE